MAEITGTALRYDGLPVDYVSIFNWADGKCIAQVQPEPSGIWLYSTIEYLLCGITYVADGCQPAVHGPYVIKGTKPHKWWRVIRIENIRSEASTGSDVGRSAATLIFVNNKGLPTNNPAKGFSASALTPTYAASKAFDNNPATFANNNYNDTATQGLDWYIGYQFDEPVIVTEIKVQMRPDIVDGGIDHEWQRADIQYSDDGISWFDVAYIEPLILERNASLITTPVIITE